ncbi:extracellular matrix protein 2 [Oryzias melastigma]|uniref:extracellular matrix protein 2 n=1 Tax=Oryzias melastigma TaxID=30732 RepID=UPI00168D6938|nr:extracellular matrix protein 2 [Oryzias melastigma]
MCVSVGQEEEEEEEEEGEGEGEGEEEEEEEEEEEPTEAPSNQTETNANVTWPPVECQIADIEISCRGVGLTQLPFLQYPQATKLDVAWNKISVITAHAFLGVPSLETLDLSQNELGDESFSQKPLFNLTSLKKLNLADNQITRIPALPPSLEELKINNNKLSGLTPDCFKGIPKNLTSLKKLNLADNQITRIPALPPSLEELKINNNKLSGLTPDCFKGLGNLLNLELQDNILHEGSVSPSAFSPLQSLLFLHLDRNLFSSIPLGLPASLQVLKIKKNQIYEVRGEALRDCIHLKELDLSHNHIYEQAIASDAWIRLKSLEALDLSYNQLMSIPVNLPRPLRKLNLQHNRISQLPSFLFRHLKPGLQALHLSHNGLKDNGIGRRAFVGTYRSLKELLLDNNHLEEVPRCIRQFKNLQMLRLDGNKIRLMKPWGVCHPRNSGSTLVSVHLENNLLEVETIPPRAFSCIIDAKGLILYPQQHKQDGNT